MEGGGGSGGSGGGDGGGGRALSVVFYQKQKSLLQDSPIDSSPSSFKLQASKMFM
jgi:hypothetical protein